MVPAVAANATNGCVYRPLTSRAIPTSEGATEPRQKPTESIIEVGLAASSGVSDS